MRPSARHRLFKQPFARAKILYSAHEEMNTHLEALEAFDILHAGADGRVHINVKNCFIEGLSIDQQTILCLRIRRIQQLVTREQITDIAPTLLAAITQLSLLPSDLSAFQSLTLKVAEHAIDHHIEGNKEHNEAIQYQAIAFTRFIGKQCDEEKPEAAPSANINQLRDVFENSSHGHALAFLDPAEEKASHTPG